jgi:hypothetical protein
LTFGFAQRQAALAGIALLAAVISLAVTSHGRRHTAALPPPVGSYTALAGSSGTVAFGKRTACGQIITAKTQGIANPVLPCGVKIYISFDGRHMLAQVIDTGPYVPGRQFDLTAALAARIGLIGVQKIHWSYAGAG